MEEICCILDTEYFNAKLRTENGQLKNNYLIRELALVKLSTEGLFQPNCYHFNLRQYKWQNLGNQSSINFQTNKVHGLSFYPEQNETVYDEDQLKPIILGAYDRYRVPDVAEVVAFKGGIYEKQLLTELQIPYVDLKNFGCPNFDKLKTMFPQQTYEICDHHKIRGDTIHCSKAEVAAFRDWIVKNCGKFRLS